MVRHFDRGLSASQRFFLLINFFNRLFQQTKPIPEISYIFLIGKPACRRQGWL